MLHCRDIVRLTALATLLLVLSLVSAYIITHKAPNTSVVPTLMLLPTELRQTAVAALPTKPFSTASLTASLTITPTLSETLNRANTPIKLHASASASTAAASETLTLTNLSPPTEAPLPTVPPSNPVPNQIVIIFSSEASPEERTAYVQSIGGEVAQVIESLDTVVVETPQTVGELPISPFVAQIEPDYYVSALLAVPPSDPLYPDQWALSAIGAPEAWLSLAPNLPEMSVAVIDSGICAEHDDLRERILPGYDFVDDDNAPQDDLGHGCAVSGIIAANIDDNFGIAGIAPNARILPLRVLNTQGLGLYSDVAAAIVYAADNGAQIINLSLGGVNRSTTLESAIDYAISKGVIVIAAAGNTGSAVMFPASYAPVIAVGSIDQTLERSSFSSYGPEIDILAPGRGILTTNKDNTWSVFTGTSFAAPHVSAAAAVEWARGESLRLDGGILSIKGDAIVTTTPSPTATPSAELTETVTPTPLPLLTPIIDNPDDLLLVPGNAALSADAEQALREVLVRERGRSIAASNYYTVSALRQEDDWYFVSVVGLMLLDPDIGWRLEDANWFGLVLLYLTEGGTWQGAIEGASAFTELLAQVPVSILTVEAKQGIDPLQWDAQAVEVYRFPWQTGARMVYGSLGVHDNGFNGVVSGWKAVDFLSNGDTNAGYAPNRLLAAAAGSIGYVCRDETSVAIRIGSLFYTHLLDNSDLLTGMPFNQGDELGQMRSGSFNDRCGYASQGTSWFHVHWGFPNTNNAFPVEDWILNLSDSIWHRGSETRGPNSLFQAGSNNAPCSAPVLNSPTGGASLSSTAISFSWTAISGCTFSGYSLRVNDSANIDDTPIIDTSVMGTSYTAVIASQWHNRELWWGVRAANSATGAEWGTSHFRINIPDTTPPTGAMTAPTDGSYQRGPMIWLQADASDSGSGVNRVEFYVWLNQQWILLNTDSTAPYEYSWNINAIPEGSIWLSANIVDNAGNQSGIIWGTFVTIDRSLPAASGIGIYYNGLWYLRSSASSGSPNYLPAYGGFGIPLAGDWNGNGTDTVGVYNPSSGQWFLRNRNDNGGVDYPVFQYGGFGIPLVGDWDGNGTDTVGVYNPSSGQWFLRNSNSSGSADYAFQYGGFGIPLVGDWDGNGTDTVGVYNPSNGQWFLRNSNASGGVDYPIFQYGGFGTPVVGDWDGNGTDTVGIYNPAGGQWFLRNSNASGAPSYAPFVYGGFGVPVVGTWSIAGAFSLEDGAMTAFSGDWEAIMAEMSPFEESPQPPTATITPTATLLETGTATPSPSPTPTPLLTETPTFSAAWTPTDTATITASPMGMLTNTPTAATSPSPSGEPSFTASPSSTTAPLTSTPTETPIVPAATASLLPPELPTTVLSPEATQEG
jgi:thermitase